MGCNVMSGVDIRPHPGPFYPSSVPQAEPRRTGEVPRAGTGGTPLATREAETHVRKACRPPTEA